MSTTLQKGSIFETLMRTCITEGFSGLSIAMSSNPRWTPGSKSLLQVISPAQSACGPDHYVVISPRVLVPDMP